MPNPRPATAVKALIDAILVRRQLKKQGVYQPGPATLPDKGQGGTRKNNRDGK